MLVILLYSKIILLFRVLHQIYKELKASKINECNKSFLSRDQLAVHIILAQIDRYCVSSGLILSCENTQSKGKYVFYLIVISKFLSKKTVPILIPPKGVWEHPVFQSLSRAVYFKSFNSGTTMRGKIIYYTGKPLVQDLNLKVLGNFQKTRS